VNYGDVLSPDSISVVPEHSELESLPGIACKDILEIMEIYIHRPVGYPDEYFPCIHCGVLSRRHFQLWIHQTSKPMVFE
jgi:hypothetical protein